MDFTQICTRIKQVTISTRDRIRSDRRIHIPLIAFLVGAIIAASYVGYREIMNRFVVPEVLGANFSLEYRKLPFDTKSIDITFSTDLDPTSVTSKNVTLSPFVEGGASVKNGNTLSYALGNKLEIGEKYTLTIASNVRSKYGVELGKELVFTIEAIAGAKATKILPSGRLDNLGQNIIVLFNIPVVALTNLDERDKLPCPLTITPKVDGKCKWTNGNILEFVPASPLQSATKYHLTVKDTPGLLFTLAGSLEDDIITPDLALTVSTGSFNPKFGISGVSSAPVNPTDLASSVELTEGATKLEPVVMPEVTGS